MSLVGRLKETIATKVSALLDRFDEPGEALDYAYKREVEQLARVRRAIMDVESSTELIETQAAQLQHAAAALERRARDELSIGNSNSAREAVARRIVLDVGLASLLTQADGIAAEERQFVEAADRLENKVNVLASSRDAMKVLYKATGSHTDIEHMIAELHDESGVIDKALRRAETLVAEVRSHAAAISALLASGALSDLERSPSSLESELASVRSSLQVEQELSKIRRSSS